MTKKLCVSFAVAALTLALSSHLALPLSAERSPSPSIAKAPCETEGEAEGVWILNSPTSRLRLAGFRPAGISANGVALPEPHSSAKLCHPDAKTLICSEYAG
jgi:hypothetical protein